jgi:hypothetical protein
LLAQATSRTQEAAAASEDGAFMNRSKVVSKAAIFAQRGGGVRTPHRCPRGSDRLQDLGALIGLEQPAVHGPGLPRSAPWPTFSPSSVVTGRISLVAELSRISSATVTSDSAIGRRL